MTHSTETKLTELPEVVEFCKTHNFPADIVGNWVWIKFDSKPPKEDRDLLKGAGFQWVPGRMEWAHNCGVPTRQGKYRPRTKYGSVPINGEDSECSENFVSQFERDCADGPQDRY